MASRRMFSIRITESARFLKMPPSSQNLYFHLGMRADDDGVVEAYPVMCMTSSTEDDLRVLIGKGFVSVLNDDLVVFIDDWMENNSIRADRKIDSIYKDLLLQIVPDAKLKSAKPSYYSRTKAICQTNDGQIADKCRSFVSIGKDRIEEDSTEKDKNIICPELDEPAPDRSGILLPLNDKTLYDVPLDKIAIWKDAYPAVNVEQELKRMAAWLESNPTRRKTQRGITKFINIWLAKEQDEGGRFKGGRQQAQELAPEDYDLPPEYKEMYKEFIGEDYVPNPDDPFQ